MNYQAQVTLLPPSAKKKNKKKRREKNFVKWATFQNGLALLTNYLGDLTLWPGFTSYPCHCAIDHFNIFYLPVDVVAEWQGCLKLFDCSDQEESANLGLILESKFFSSSGLRVTSLLCWMQSPGDWVVVFRYLILLKHCAIYKKKM